VTHSYISSISKQAIYVNYSRLRACNLQVLGNEGKVSFQRNHECPWWCSNLRSINS